MARKVQLQQNNSKRNRLIQDQLTQAREIGRRAPKTYGAAKAIGKESPHPEHTGRVATRVEWPSMDSHRR